MKMRKMSRFNILFTHCRSNMYLIIGICLGLSVSLLFAPVEINDCEDLSDPLPYPSSSRQDFVDEYEPKINVKEKPQQAQKTPKAFVRPRYYSTELGIREKLFVGVITSKEYLHSRGVALNKTISHLVDKVRFFISIPEGAKPNVSLPGIVGFTDTRNILKPFHVMKYITDNYLEDYDYYFLVKDSGFLNARRLKDLVDKLSVSQDIHLGVNSSKVENYCSLDAGILLSNSVAKELKTNLDWCVKNIYSDSDDVNFGRCILHAIPVPCSNSAHGKHFKSTNLPGSFNFDRDFLRFIQRKDFDDSISIFPLEHHNIYKMNAYFTSLELSSVEQKIMELRKDILKTAKFGPKNQRNVSWPVGNQPGNKAPGRFDIRHWIYFNQTHSFLETDFETLRALKGSAKKEVDQILHAGVEKVIGDYSEGKLIFKNLINGYKKFDASRGMDYVLDINFLTDSGEEMTKRIQISKPLGKVEILPVPYVTENSRINMILIVDSMRKKDTMKFLEHYAQTCLEKKDKIVLMMVLLYDPNSPSKGREDTYFEIKRFALSLTEKYKKDQAKVTWLSIRLPVAFNLIETEPLLKIAIADLSVRKFSPENLILFVDMGMEIRTDYLNRVRMNTINQWQVFSPIPFVEFHPDIIHTDNKIDFDVVRNLGRYDDYNYNSVAFYAKDYTNTRKNIEAKISVVRTDKDISTILKTENWFGSIFEMFVSFSELHSFRAVEPALKIRYKEINCNGTRSGEIFKKCRKQKNLQLGHRGDLTKLILEYQSEL